MATWEDVRRLALELPQTEEGTTFGNLAWKTNGKGFIWERPLRRSDVEALGSGAPGGPILGLRTENLLAKDALLESGADAIFTTPHFNGYPAILVELQKIGVDELRELIEEAWLACAPKRVAKAYLDSR
jgi:hypothetical protein